MNLEIQERLLPYHLPVMRVGFLPRKKQWVYQQMPSEFSFNIVLSGSGYLRDGENVYKIKPPCLFVPVDFCGCNYGPNTVWEELFIICSADLQQEFERCGYIGRRQIYYDIDIHNLAKLIEKLTQYLDDISRPGVVDRIDSLCETIIRESILSHGRVSYGPGYHKMLAVREQLRSRFTDDPDVVALARQCGMSTSTFRRNWARYFGMPPKQYTINVRIERASSLLIAGELKIKEVAHKVGFSDPLYFSKVFHKVTGFTPSQFRDQYS